MGQYCNLKTQQKHNVSHGLAQACCVSQSKSVIIKIKTNVFANVHEKLGTTVNVQNGQHSDQNSSWTTRTSKTL